MRRVLGLFSAVAVTSCLLTVLPSASMAQSGINLWSGVRRENQLNHRFDFGGQPNSSDRLRLRVDAQRSKTAIAQLVISYPRYYKGSFDPKKIQVKARGKSIPLQEARWDKANHVIEIFPAEPIPAGTGLEIILSNIRTPTFGGMYYFNFAVQSPGDVPLSRYIGTWIISVAS